MGIRNKIKGVLGIKISVDSNIGKFPYMFQIQKSDGGYAFVNNEGRVISLHSDFSLMIKRLESHLKEEFNEN